jgi:hypothetical protein
VGWFLLGGAGVALLVTRPRWNPGIRITIAAAALAATALGYFASWMSSDLWWIGSLLTVGILIAARLTTSNIPTRASVVGAASVIGLVAAGAAGWRLNEQLATGRFGGIEALHAVVLIAVALVALSALLARTISTIETRVVFWISLATASVGAGLTWASRDTVRMRDLLVVPEFTISLLLSATLLAALLLWTLLPRTSAYRPERIAAALATAAALSWLLDSLGRALDLLPFIVSLGPMTAALVVSAISLAIARRQRSDGRARDAGIALVALPALFVAAVFPSGSTWLVLLLGGVTALLLAVSADGLFASDSPRKHLGWVALALATAGLWWRLGDGGVRDVEPYVLPLAGALLAIAALAWRASRDTRSTVPAGIAFGGLAVALLPIAVVATSGTATRTIIIGAVSATVLLLGSLLPGDERRRPYLDVAALAGGLGVLVAFVGRSTVMSTDRVTDDLALDAWLGAGLALLLIAAIGQSRVRHDGSRRIRSVIVQSLVGLVMAAVLLVEISVLVAGPIGTIRAAAVLLLFCAIHVAGLLLDRLPITRLLGWMAIGFAAVVSLAATALGAIDPLEWATAALGTALLIVGATKLRRTPTAGSWPWLAPGIAVVLLPSLIATFVEQPIVRLVALGLACVVAIIVGAVGRLQAPLLIGSVVVLVHAIRTFAPQLVAVYQLTEWWVWAVVGGAIILFIALTFERRVRDLRTVGMKIGSLR